MSHRLLDAWKSVAHSRAPFILKGDGAALGSEGILWNSLDESAFLDSDQFLRKSDQFFMGLVPQPYLGRVLNASVYILMLNPGFSSLDLYAESNEKAFKSALLEQLDGTRPNLYMDPRFHWTGGFQYWTGKLSRHVDKLGEIFARKPSNVLSFIADEVAILELVPYHSARCPLSPGSMRRLESVRLMREFFAEYVLPRCANDECSVVVSRGAGVWKASPAKNVLVYSPQQARAAHFGLQSEGGRVILNRLVRSAEAYW